VTAEQWSGQAAILSHMTSGRSSTPPVDGQMVGVDALDRDIIAALRADGRLSMRALAEQLHISRAGAYSRVARLERDGVITGYAATIDPSRVGAGLSAYVYLKIAQQSWKALQGRIMQMAEVEHAALVSGDYDIVLLIRTGDTATLRHVVLESLQRMPEVVATQTVLIFEEATGRGTNVSH
jgi:DNA-binding Lrp family transcriptional regulator